MKKEFTAAEVKTGNTFSELTPERGIKFLEKNLTPEEQRFIELGLKLRFGKYELVGEPETQNYEGEKVVLTKGYIHYTIE